VSGEIVDTHSFEGAGDQSDPYDRTTENTTINSVGPGDDAITYTGNVTKMSVAEGDDGAACVDILIEGEKVTTLCTDGLTSDETRTIQTPEGEQNVEVGTRTSEDQLSGFEDGDVLAGSNPNAGLLDSLLIPELLPGIGPLSSKTTTLLGILLALAVAGAVVTR
jgi:hypothetical protein